MIGNRPWVPLVVALGLIALAVFAVSVLNPHGREDAASIPESPEGLPAAAPETEPVPTDPMQRQPVFPDPMQRRPAPTNPGAVPAPEPITTDPVGDPGP
jgi:hypothetical protein